MGDRSPVGFGAGVPFGWHRVARLVDSGVLLPAVVQVDRGAVVLARPDHLLEVAGQVPHVQLGYALVPHVRFQAGGVQARPQQPLGQLHAHWLQPVIRAAMS